MLCWRNNGISTSLHTKHQIILTTGLAWRPIHCLARSLSHLTGCYRTRPRRRFGGSISLIEHAFSLLGQHSQGKNRELNKNPRFIRGHQTLPWWMMPFDPDLPHMVGCSRSRCIKYHVHEFAPASELFFICFFSVKFYIPWPVLGIEYAGPQSCISLRRSNCWFRLGPSSPSSSQERLAPNCLLSEMLPCIAQRDQQAAAVRAADVPTLHEHCWSSSQIPPARSQCCIGKHIDDHLSAGMLCSVRLDKIPLAKIFGWRE